MNHNLVSLNKTLDQIHELEGDVAHLLSWTNLEIIANTWDEESYDLLEWDVKRFHIESDYHLDDQDCFNKFLNLMLNTRSNYINFSTSYHKVVDIYSEFTSVFDVDLFIKLVKDYYEEEGSIESCNKLEDYWSKLYTMCIYVFIFDVIEDVTWMVGFLCEGFGDFLKERTSEDDLMIGIFDMYNVMEWSE